MVWGLVWCWVQIHFQAVLGTILESPNTTLVAFGDMASGRAVRLARVAFGVMQVVMDLFCVFV